MMNKKPKKRLPISAVQVKKLGFEHDLMILASEACGLDLAELLDRAPTLLAAWERGQFLRRLWAVGKEAYSPSQAAKVLGLSQKDFDRLLATNREARQLWDEARLHLDIEIRRRILRSVEMGKMSIYNLLKLLSGLMDIRQVTNGPPDIYHVGPKELAQLFGITRETLHTWHRRHGLVRNADGETYDLRVVLPWYRRWLLKAAVQRGLLKKENTK